MSAATGLSGRRVLVTRGLDKPDTLPRLLEEAGATVVQVPLIATSRLGGDGEIRDALARLRRRGGAAGARRWLVVTSETAVALVVDAAGERALDGLAFAAVGPATAAALEARGLIPGLVAAGQEAESLAAELAALGVAGAGALVFEAAGGRNVVAPALAAAGADVEALPVYATVMPDGSAEALRAELGRAPVDAVIFTSGSTVRHFARAQPSPPIGVMALCIGPVTALAARDAGWSPVVTATEHTSAGLLEAAIARLGRAQPLP